MSKSEVTAILLLCATIPARPIFGGDTSTDRETLRGLQSVRVVCDIETKAEKFGLKPEQIQTDTELQLRKAGIKVNEEDMSRFVYVNVNAVESGAGTLAVALEVAFEQTVALERAPDIKNLVPTWGFYPVVLTVPESQYVQFVRQRIRDLADRFANAFLSMNPK